MSYMVIRKTKYAGSWYPKTSDSLKRVLDKYFTDNEFGPGQDFKCLNKEKREIIGGVSGHAGLSLSGPCSSFTYLNLFKERIPDTVIIIGFHHREPYGNVFLSKGEWETPLGNLKIDVNLAQDLISSGNILKPYEKAFLMSDENSVELQMPFIKYCAGEKDVKILPIKIQSHNYSDLERIAEEISKIIKSSNKDIVLVASSDMSHYNIFNEDQLHTLKKIDQGVIEQFIKLEANNILDPSHVINKKLYDQFDHSAPTVCGSHTIATLILTCKKLNISKARCLKYYTSKDISPGGNPWTVGYFSGIIIK